MTTELEEQFFKTFGIEQKVKTIPCYGGCKIVGLEPYSEITAEKLLQIICILSAYNYIFEDLKADNIEQLKEEIIKLFFDYPLIVEEEKTNIQQLFKVDDTHKSTMLNIITDEEY